MDTARIAELLQPFLVTEERVEASADQTVSLTASQLQNISTYIDILLRWNARINLTSIRDPEEIVTRHFGESFFAARLLFPSAALETILNRVPHLDFDSQDCAEPARPAAERRQNAAQGASPGLTEENEPAPQGRKKNHDPGASVPEVAVDLIDLGSGAGFPGLPIKLWAPRLRVTLIESNQKKATFLREVIRSLTLTDVDVFAGRAEDFSGHAGVVTLRAVEHFEDALPISARLCALKGRLALLIGQSQVKDAKHILPAMNWLPPISIPLAAARVLLVGYSREPQ